MINTQQQIQQQYKSDIQEMKSWLSILTSPEKYRKGVQYYKEGRILTFEMKQPSNIVTADVAGGNECYYQVRIDLGRLTGRCGCPSDEPQQKCKHVIATVYALADNDYQPNEKLLQTSRSTIEQDVLFENIQLNNTKGDNRSASSKSHILKRQLAELVRSKESTKLKYPKYLKKFLEEATDADKLALLMHLLETEKVTHSATKLWLESQALDMKSVIAFVNKQKKGFAHDFYGEKSGRLILEIDSFFANVIHHIEMNVNSAVEKCKLWLQILQLIYDELIYEGYNFVEIEDLYEVFALSMVTALETDPLEIKPIVEMALNRDVNQAIWRALVSWGQEQARRLVLERIEFSNTRTIEGVESNAYFQLSTLALIVMRPDLTTDDPFFYSVIAECDLISEKKRTDYYKLYYNRTGQMEKYLQYCDSLSGDRIDRYEFFYLLESNQWEKVQLILDRVLSDRDYAINSRSVLTLKEAASLQRDLIEDYHPVKTAKDRELKKQSLLTLYEFVAQHQNMNEADKATFFWESGEYLRLLDYFKWFRTQSLLQNNYTFKSGQHKKSLLFYLRALSAARQTPDIQLLFKTLLMIEQDYLRECRSNNYEFTIEVVATCHKVGLIQEIQDFVHYCTEHYARRKKLIEELQKFIQ